MKKYLFHLLALTATCFSLNVKAQSADDVINKYFDAVGGREKLGKIETEVVTGSMQVMGNSSPYTISIVNGVGFKNELDFNGSKIVQCVTDKGGWQINPMMGGADPVALKDDEYAAQKESIYVNGPLFNYAADGGKVELLPNEQLGDINAIKVKLTTPAAEYTYYFDPSTYFVLKMLKSVGGMETAVAYSDYRKTDYGTMHPFSSEITLPQGFTLSAQVEKVEINGKVDPVIFSMGK